MKWKKFTEELPPSDTRIIIRFTEITSVHKNYWAYARVDRPADTEPLIYHPDYYRLYREDTLLDLCDEYKNMYEWLNPMEDRQS